MSSSALSCRGVSVRFGQFQALTGIDIDFRSGETTALIGPNGAGKTTLVNVLSGLLEPSGGRVSLGATDITRTRASRRAALGIARSFQIISVYPAMTVLENVRLGVQRAGRRAPIFWRGVSSLKTLKVKTLAHLDEFGLADRCDAVVGTLSYGQQRTLELALTLVGNPRILLLDEPLAGVGHSETDAFLTLLRRAVAGRTTVLVEHNMDAVLQLADSIVCLIGGQVLAHAAPDAIRDDPRVRAAYLGETAC